MALRELTVYEAELELRSECVAQRAQGIIARRYRERVLLPDLAAELGISQRTLTRRFCAATGLTPLRYQRLLRLERAEELLAAGTSLETAARSVGFTDSRMLRRLRSAEGRCSAVA